MIGEGGARPLALCGVMRYRCRIFTAARKLINRFLWSLLEGRFASCLSSTKGLLPTRRHRSGERRFAAPHLLLKFFAAGTEFGLGRDRKFFGRDRRMTGHAVAGIMSIEAHQRLVHLVHFA